MYFNQKNKRMSKKLFGKNLDVIQKRRQLDIKYKYDKKYQKMQYNYQEICQNMYDLADRENHLHQFLKLLIFSIIFVFFNLFTHSIFLGMLIFYLQSISKRINSIYLFMAPKQKKINIKILKIFIVTHIITEKAQILYIKFVNICEQKAYIQLIRIVYKLNYKKILIPESQQKIQTMFKKQTPSSPEQYLIKYKKIKQSLDLPLKINLYFTLLETSLTQKPTQRGTQFFNGFSPLFYPVFCHQSKLQKCRYLYSNIEFIREQYDKIETLSVVKQIKCFNGNSIRASGQISQSLMGLVYWSKVQVIFDYQTRKIRLIAKNRNVQIDLRLYLMRVSKKYQNTIVFEAISEIVPTNDRKISIFLKSAIFQHIHKQIFRCILAYRNQQLYKIAFEQSNSSKNLEISFIGNNSKSLSFLGTKTVNQFLNFKDYVSKKMMRANFDFQNVFSANGRKIQVDKNSFNSKQGVIYKLESLYSCTVQQLKKNFLAKYSTQSNKYLIQSQQIQKYSNKYSAVYQKYLFETANETFKTIQHVMIQQINQRQVIYDNQQLIFQRGLKSVKLDQFFQYLIVKIKSFSNQKKSKLIVVGCFNSSFKQIQNKQNNKKPVINIPETHQMITMFLLEFAQMIFRKEYQIQNMKKMIEQLRGLEKQDNQFVTVQGQFPEYENQQVVLDVDQQQKYVDKENYPTFEVSSLNSNKKLERVQSCISELNQNFLDSQQQQFQDFESPEEENIKNFYLFHQYQLLPQTQALNKQKVLCSHHFLYHQWDRKPKGGLLCKDDKMINEQKKVANYLIKNLGKRIFQQKGLLNISLPVTIFRPESHLQAIARNLSFAPIFLEKASKMNPLQRLKMVLLYSLSVTISSISVSKPFNPFLGETLQVWIDGCPVYLEQISHHPPIVAYYMIGRGYKVYGSIGPKINFGFNSIVGYAQQPNFVQFDDGTVIELNFGKMIIKGIVIGERIFNFIDKMFAIDPKNKLFYQLKFGEQKSFFSKSLEPEDYFSGKIYKISEEFIKKFFACSDVTYPTKQTIISQLSTFEGIWNGKVYINNNEQINFAQANGCIIQEQKFPLPSDSSYRKDIKYLKQGSINSSQVQKEALENIQRRDRTLRETHQKK